MNEEEKRSYLQNYSEDKKKGVPFFPDIIFKDVIVAFIVLLVLIGLAYFLGAPLEERADPSDTNYTPRPEWYFLFLFQLLKYFPGKLEVFGVIVLPTLAILGLFLLPFIDRTWKRHALNRKSIISVATLSTLGIVVLTILSIVEAPPPSETTQGDRTAALYAQNCAPCHGDTISVPAGTNLHAVIAIGQHEGMPAWSADLTSDEIDALAGFILSPGGSKLFTENCAACHQLPSLVSSNPVALRQALEEGPQFPPHLEIEVPDWSAALSQDERTDLLNFLLAPDGERLFALNCSSCHGSAVAFSGDTLALTQIISQGGLHLEMPPWRETLTTVQLDTLAAYVVDPPSAPGGEDLFASFCSACHGNRVPASNDLEQARQTIELGGTHETMPVWGSVLTPEQLNALVAYTLEAAEGTPIELGRELYAQNCAICHGSFGEGGINPARPDDIIAPISSAEYLETRDDATIQAIISQGQPNFGMSPFGSVAGGPLDDDQIDAIVAFMRVWEANPPVELPPEVAGSDLAITGPNLFASVCSQCHGLSGEGGIGPSFQTDEFQTKFTDTTLAEVISTGHPATAMIAWGEILSTDQIALLVETIRSFYESGIEQPQGESSFGMDVLPILDAKCKICHGSLGGWDGTSYDAVMTSGDNAPTVIPGDAENSLLAQKLLGTQTSGSMMPTSGLLPSSEIQVILDWITAGAKNN
jgi:mono/diheme cytochrome c family protein